MSALALTCDTKMQQKALQVLGESYDNSEVYRPHSHTSNERRRGFSLRRQARSVLPLGALWFVGLLILAGAQVQTAAPLRELFLDPASLTGAPWYTGALSNLGIFVWTAGVAFAAAGSWIARRTGRDEAAKFLAVGSIATLIMVFDDIFAIHSSVLNDVTWLPKVAAQALIVSPTIVWVLAFLHDIRRTRFLILFAALSSLAGSLLVDQASFFSGESALLIEDGLKFLGILAWCQYFALTARDIAESSIAVHINSDSAGTPPADSEEKPHGHLQAA